MNDFNLIDEFEEEFWLSESDDNSSQSEDEIDRQIRFGNLRTFYSQRRKMFELFDDEKTRKTMYITVSAEGCITVTKHSKHAARTETMKKKVTQRRQDN
ncbi:hypothetical protein OUZ56_012788 [Daphnia magna]|uniref:Uncharacterized protein n=1 Tax=Daphnia magna TaxID=35525 RepID=A0ABQ9Z423_9CRUS|nr:hypothetical protein OUZ56_012788 [Daphnia magna]